MHVYERQRTSLSTQVRGSGKEERQIQILIIRLHKDIVQY